MSSTLPVLHSVTKKQRARSRISALLWGSLLGGGAAYIVHMVFANLWGADTWDRRPEDQWTVIGGVAIIALCVLWNALVWRRHPVLRALASTPPARAYVENVTVVGAAYRKTFSLVVVMKNGKQVKAEIGDAVKDPRVEEIGRAVVRELAYAYPEISVGWSAADDAKESERLLRQLETDISPTNRAYAAQLRAQEAEKARYRNGHLVRP